METRLLTDGEIDWLESLGWQFLRSAPNVWGWVKFDANGNRVAIQGDPIWDRDMPLLNMENAGHA